MDQRYWPFDVGSPEKFSDQDRREVDFLKVAYLAGYKPYDLGLGSFSYGATANNQRVGEIIARGRHSWEVWLCGDQRRVLSAYLDDFACAADAVLGWLRGADAKEILAQLQNHLVVLPGASRSFSLNLPDAAPIQAGMPVAHDGK